MRLAAAQVQDQPATMPVRPRLVPKRPAFAAADPGVTDCTIAPFNTLKALAT